MQNETYLLLEVHPREDLRHPETAIENLVSQAPPFGGKFERSGIKNDELTGRRIIRYYPNGVRDMNAIYKYLNLQGFGRAELMEDGITGGD